MVTEIAGLYVDEFHCEQNMMSHWYPRLRPLWVPTPETYKVDLIDGEPDYEYIQRIMRQEGWNRAFIRGDSFSDKINPRTGSVIQERDLNEVRRTFETLKNHLINHMDTPMGEAVYVREMLDLDYCKAGDLHDHWHPTELRYIVENGEIQYVAPSLESLEEINLAHSCTYDYVQDAFAEEDLSEPYQYAMTVAEEFDEYSWHVDFCLTTSMDWYCIDMGLNGVYQDDETGEWRVMTGQPESVEEQMLKRAREIPDDLNP